MHRQLFHAFYAKITLNRLTCTALKDSEQGFKRETTFHWTFGCFVIYACLIAMCLVLGRLVSYFAYEFLPWSDLF